jgi:predicted nucleotidyltransferase
VAVLRDWVIAESPPPLLPLFRSRNQLVLLTEVFVRSGVARSVSELARATGISKAVISHELDRLAGRLRLVDANPSLPYFAELRSMLLKTMGPAALLRDALASLGGIEEAFVFGSWAARYHGEEGPPPRDIDLLVVGSPDISAVTAICRKLSRELAMTVQVAFRTVDEWQRADDDVFLGAVKSGALVQIL